MDRNGNFLNFFVLRRRCTRVLEALDESIDRAAGSVYILDMPWTSEQTRTVARRRLRKAAERTQELEKRRLEARTHAEALAEEIGAADTTVRRIWGFGSVFDERLPFRASSDIDLAVEGGSILAWKLSQRTLWDVDWVDLSEQSESIVKAIKTTGMILYERQ